MIIKSSTFQYQLARITNKNQLINRNEYELIIMINTLNGLSNSDCATIIFTNSCLPVNVLIDGKLDNNLTNNTNSSASTSINTFSIQ